MKKQHASKKILKNSKAIKIHVYVFSYLQYNLVTALFAAQRLLINVYAQHMTINLSDPALKLLQPYCCLLYHMQSCIPT